MKEEKKKIERAIILLSYMDSLKSFNLNREDENELIRSIVEYQLYSKEPNFNGLLSGIWILIKPNIETSMRYSRAGAPKGNTNAKKKTTEEQLIENKQKQLIENKQKQSVETMDKDKDRDKDREIVSKSVELQMLVNMFNPPEYSLPTITELWNELSDDDRKFAFERIEEYLKWENNRGKKKPNLQYYLKDKKWTYELITKKIQGKLNLEGMPKPYTEEWYEWRKERTVKK